MTLQGSKASLNKLLSHSRTEEPSASSKSTSDLSNPNNALTVNAACASSIVMIVPTSDAPTRLTTSVLSVHATGKPTDCALFAREAAFVARRRKDQGLHGFTV